MLVIALNGPPRCGKDTACSALVKTFRHARGFKLSSPIKRGTHAAFNLMVPEDHFEQVKDTPAEEFYRLTPRQAYINHSEKYMKPLYGQDVFGQLMVRQLAHHSNTRLKVAIISDCGFVPEKDAIAEKHLVYVLRIHRVGHDFKNDSRGYIDHENSSDITNSGDPASYTYLLQSFVREKFKDLL